MSRWHDGITRGSVSPRWSSAARLQSPVQPSSASAERVFSLLQAAFSDQQVGTLEDELEASVMRASITEGNKSTRIYEMKSQFYLLLCVVYTVNYGHS